MKSIILHIGDAHISSKNKEVVKTIFSNIVKDIKDLNTKPDYIVFCGDVSFAGQPDQYMIAKELLETELLSPLSLSKDHLLIVPGNHDIDRNQTLEPMETSWAKISSREQLTTFIKNEDKSNEQQLIKKKIEPYLEFGKHYRSLTDENIFVKSHLLDDDFSIGVLCINTAWLSSEYGTDTGRLIVMDEMVSQQARILREKGAQCVVAVLHHPPSSLNEWNQRSTKQIFAKTCDLILTGHYHNEDSELIKKHEGCFYHLTCKSLHSEKMHCGYNLIELNKGLSVTFRSWDNERIEFNADSNNGLENGYYKVCDFTFQDKSIQTSLDLIKLKSDLIGDASELDLIVKPFEELEQHISVTDVFVEPVLTNACNPDKIEKSRLISLNELLENYNHTVIFGKKEHGKTTLLRYLQERILHEESPTVPVFLDFKELPKNNPNGLIAIIRGKFNGGCNAKQVVDYLENGNISLLVDDYGNVTVQDFEKRKRVLATFIAKHPKCRLIATATSGIQHQDDVLSALKTPVIHYNLASFTTAKVRDLLTKWESFHHFNIDEVLKKIMKFFNRLRLPVTPFAATLFIGVLVGERKQKNIYNEAYLVENYIETLLEKVGDSGVAHEMDFPEKTSFLAFITWKMYELNKYVLDVNDFERFKIEFYDEFDEDIPDQDEFKIFFKKGLLRNVGGEISFQFRFTFYFFLAKALQKHPAGIDDIFSNQKVLLYSRALSYKAGLERNDIGILTRIGELIDQKLITHKKRYASTKLEKLGIEKGLIEYSKNVKAELNAGNQNDVHDNITDETYLNYDENDQEIQYQENVDSIAELLVLHSDVIRNSREIKATVKRTELKNHINRYQYLIFEVIEQFVFLLEGLNNEKLLSLLNIKKKNAKNDEIAKAIKGLIVQSIPVSAIIFIADNLGNPKLAKSLTHVIANENEKERSLLYILVLYLLDSKKGEQELRKWLDQNKNTYILDNLAWMVIKYDAHTRKLSEKEIDKIVSLLDTIRHRHPAKKVNEIDYIKDEFRTGTKKELLKSSEKFADSNG